MRWNLRPIPPKEEVTQLANSLGIPTTIATLLAQRGIDSFEAAKAFYRPSLEQLHDPFLMKDMDLAVARIESAIAQNQNILVYGDYDVDGTSSVALMASYLQSYYANVGTYIPDRYNEGYGVSIAGIDYAADNDCTLIIALDCGVKAIKQIAYAKEKGIDFIVCDHHRPGAELPDAIAVLDPKRDDCDYPYKELCGCGVGFKLVQGLHQQRDKEFDELLPCLDLVATAIGADIVPITGENRILAYYGMQVINQLPRPGFQAILNSQKKEAFTITDVVFIIAPRINAAGRMKHGLHAVNLLMEQNLENATAIAQEIETYNLTRREADMAITQEALAMIESDLEQDRFTTVVYDAEWHKGVIGIVASRLIETYYRPTIVFTKSGDVLAASARSVRGFDVYQAIAACSEHLIQFGGHKYAAGLTIKPENYKSFKDAFEAEVKNTIKSSMRVPELQIDMQLDLNEINPKFYRLLRQFAPFGPGNMTPVFMTEGLKDTGWAKGVGENGAHLKLTVEQGGSEKINAIGFGLGDRIAHIKGTNFSAAFTVDENTWQGRTSLQLKIKDLKH
ncbi:MAG: single-stranded-DNA-specific exonuclease RecJ [Gilvibacter sp.]